MNLKNVREKSLRKIKPTNFIKFFSVLILIFVLFTNRVDAYYSAENRFSVFNLRRNINPVKAVVSYDKTTLTNQDVEVNISFDKIISIIGDNNGLKFSEDGKTLSKVLSKNESSTLLIRDEDFNYQNVKYNVNWIDKELPIISGAQNGKTYNGNVHLDFTDNVKVREIYADSYSDSFSIYTDSQDFYETDNLRIVPATKNTIRAYVLSNTKQIEKYNYYIDGKLCATTHDKKYTFTGLELSDELHHIVVEGLDRYGNVLETKETYRKTIPVNKISVGNSEGIEYISLMGVPETLKSITATIWVSGKEDSILKVNPVNNAPNSYLVAAYMGNHKNYSGRYMVRFDMEYVENGINKNSQVIGSFYLPTKYKGLNLSGLPNDFIENGNYYVRCIDEAGNEAEIEFSVQK